MRTILFVISAILSMSVLFLEDVVAQQRRDFGWDLPPIPVPGKKQSAVARAPETLDGTPEGECDRKKNNSLACRFEVYVGRQTKLVQLAQAEGRLIGTWTLKTLVTMTNETRPKEIAVNPDIVPIRGLRWSPTAVESISDVPRSHRQAQNGRAFSVREDGFTVDLYLTGSNVPELALACRLVRLNSSGDNLICLYYESPAARNDNFSPKGYVTFGRAAAPRPRAPEIAEDPWERRSPEFERRRSPFFW